MQSLKGNIIKASPSMEDPVFSGTAIFICEHNENGATGFVYNKPFLRSLNELEALKYSKPFPLYDGGPVDKEHLFLLHLRPDIIEQGTLISDGIYLGGNFDQAVEAINKGAISSGQVKLFIGYCGWNTNELDEEITGGSWQLTTTPAKDVFNSY